VRLRPVLSIAIAVVLAASAIGHATPGNGNSKGLGHDKQRCEVLGCGDDVAEAVALENRMADHFYYGQVMEAYYRTPERLTGDVRGLGGWGDSGLWTGVYLGGESFRYAVAKDHLRNKHISDADLAFWTAQRDAAKARVTEMVAKYHLLVNIGKNWPAQACSDGAAACPVVDPYGEFKPGVDTTDPTKSKLPTMPHTQATLGRAVVPGEAGMLMRACTPTDAPAHIGIGQNRRVFGPFEWEDGKSYVCETAPSRDTYAGTTFGLLAAFDLVSADDPAMRTTIRDDVMTLTRFLVKNGWSFPRPHGNVSLPPFGHDFDNFVSPLFVQVPMARLNMANAGRHVADLAGTAADQQFFDSVWTEELASQGPILAGSMVVDSLQPNDGYYKFNLHHLTASTLLRTLTDPVERTVVAHAVGVLDRTTRDDINAHFEAITFGATGEEARLDDAVTHLREWRDYYARVHAEPVTNNESRCGKDITCVPEDQYGVATGPGEDTSATWKPGNTDSPGETSDLRASLPLAVADRAPSDFLWQRPPTKLNETVDPGWEPAGVDYLTPYWMLRYFTEVAKPAVSPFPAYAGPSFR
jgi:hypothetical protein